MTTTAGEGINSDGREVTMTAQERGKTGAEMTGTTGKKEMYSRDGKDCQSQTAFTEPCAATSCPTQLNGLKFKICLIPIQYFLKSISKGVGQGQGTT